MFFDTNAKNRVWRIALVAMLSLSLGSLYAQDDDDDDDDDGDWRKERAELQREIDKQVKIAVEQRVTKEKVVEQLAKLYPMDPPALPWEWPIQEELNVVKTTKEVEDKLAKQLQGEAAIRFPERAREQFQTEVEAKYSLYQPGDKVNFILRNGYGTNVKVNGTFYNLSPERLRVGARWIARRDISEEDQAHFYTDVRDELVKKEVAQRNRVYTAKIENFITDGIQERLPSALLKSGFVPDKPRKKNAALNNPNTDTWIRREAYVEYWYDLAYDMETEKQQKEISARVFRENDYVYDTKGQEWLPREEYDARQAEEQRRAEEERRRREGGDMLMPGMMPGM